MSADLEAISQAEIETIRDQAIGLARFPAAVLDGGAITHAAAYTIGESRVVVEIFDFPGDTDPNPMFSVVRAFNDIGIASSGLERDFTFTPGGFRRPKYDCKLQEDVKVFDDRGKAVNPPRQTVETTEEKKIHRARKDEIDQLHKDIGFGELTRDKVEEMIGALSVCGAWNLLDLGEAALARRSYWGN